MTPLALLNPDGVTVGRAALAEAIAGQPIKQHLIHETVVAELAARRAGTSSTLTRGRVRGGGSKPWRQKGTGRARHGSIRAPQWTGGGVVFGPTPRSYGGKVNRKVRQQAFRAALRAHAERGTAALMDPTGWEAPSTKRAAEYLRQASDALGGRPLLVVVEDLAGAEARSFRNLAGVEVLEAGELQTVDLVAARAILVERVTWERLAGELGEVEAVEPKPKPKPRKKAPPKPKPAPKPSEPVAEEEPEPEAEVVEEAQAAVVEEPEAAEPEAPAQDVEAPAEEAPKPKRTRASKPPAEEPEPEAAEAEAAAEEEAPKPKPRPRKPAAKKPPAKKPEPEAEPEATEEPS